MADLSTAHHILDTMLALEASLKSFPTSYRLQFLEYVENRPILDTFFWLKGRLKYLTCSAASCILPATANRHPILSAFYTRMTSSKLGSSKLTVKYLTS